MHAALIVLAEILIKASLVLSIALVVHACLRHARAALREHVLRLAFGAVALVPFAVVYGPRIQWQVLPAVQVAEAEAAGAWIGVLPAGTDSGSVVSEPLPGDQAAVFIPAVPGAVKPDGQARSGWLATALICVWALGVLMALYPLLRGVQLARGIARRSRRCSAADWGACDDVLAAGLALRRRPRLVVSREVAVPFVWDPLPMGAPVVVLPAAELLGDQAAASAALQHEYAHVARRDGQAAISCGVIAALLWATPLVWWSLRVLRQEAERAADDVVLGSGVVASDYAAQLMALIPSTASPRMASVAGMAGAGAFERRVRCLLDREQRRGGLARRARLGLALGTALVALPLAFVEARAVQDPEVPAGSALSRGVAALLVSQDKVSGGWIADVGYKLNNSFRVSQPSVAHVGVTGLALDALLSAAPRPWSSELRSALAKAADFLVSRQVNSGYISAEGTGMRAHAHALVALAHWQELEPSDHVADALQAAVRFTYEAQNDAGGWRFVPNSQYSDVLETAYQVRALLRAQTTGVSVPPDVLARALAHVKSLGVADSASSHYGAFRYQDNPKARITANTVAAGLLTTASLGPLEVNFGVAGLVQLQRLRPQDVDAKDRTFLDWDTELLSGLALATYAQRDPQRGRPIWATWRRVLLSRLSANQQASGAWSCEPGPSSAYSTAIACLLLSMN
ncbi:MAG: beta-lactamase regulating signal transducer with metallopeptidase domain [Planctomycetota bacterium]|jgi:beta-lactamase regulating signal transducer with metallopeptidase domain